MRDFEKMLYDNAQLARVYLHAWQLTDNALYRAVAQLDFIHFDAREKPRSLGRGLSLGVQGGGSTCAST